MIKIKTPTYFAPVNFGAGGCWGAGDSPDRAVKNACREALAFAKAFGGFKPGARLDINVFAIRPGCYAHQDERGIFEVDDATDEIVAYAAVACRYEGLDPRRPLTSARLGKPADAYHDGGAALERANAERRAPIGQTVA